MVVVHGGGKFGGGGFKVSGGLHGVGAGVVNARSSTLEVDVQRNGKVYYLGVEQGIAQEAIKVIGDTDITGTITHFKPDPEIFTEITTFDFDTLAQRLRELAFLNKGIAISLEDKRTDEEPVKYYYEGGISSYVE